MIRFRTAISVHIDSERQIVRLRCGDHRRYYRDAVAFSREAYEAPPPGDADIVIANTYPEDLSLLFARMKGFVPLRRAKPSASRIAIARCTEGVGFHGLFPELTRTRGVALRDLVRRAGVMGIGEVTSKVAQKAAQKLRSSRGAADRGGQTKGEYAISQPQNPIWLYISGTHSGPLPDNIPGVRLCDSWGQVLEGIQKEQGGQRKLKAVFYPCVPIQCVAEKQVHASGEAEMGMGAAQE
jgi:hypothetical protein